MNKLNIKEFEETFKERLIKRNQPLFDLLSALEGQVPAPAIDFDPEDGGVEFVWIYNKRSVSICMERQGSKYGAEYKSVWMVADTIDCRYGHNPTPEFIKAELDLLLSN